MKRGYQIYRAWVPNKNPPGKETTPIDVVNENLQHRTTAVEEK